MKRALVFVPTLALCASAFATVIYSPKFGKYVTGSSPISFNTSVDSSDTPGSDNFSPSAHRALDKTALTAYYAIFDGAMCRAYDTAYGASTKTAKNVSTNNLIDYGNFLNLNDQLRELSFRRGNGYWHYVNCLSSSKFDESAYFYKALSVDGTTYSMTDNCKCMVTVGDFCPGNQYIDNTWYTYEGGSGSDRIFYRELAHDRGEYSASGTSQPDYIESYRTNNYYITNWSGDYADLELDFLYMLYDNYYVPEVTNKSYALTWGPLAAACQIMAPFDAQVGAYEQPRCRYYRYNTETTYTKKTEYVTSDVTIVKDGSEYKVRASDLPLSVASSSETQSTNTYNIASESNDLEEKLYVSTEVQSSAFEHRETIPVTTGGLIDLKEVLVDNWGLEANTTNVITIAMSGGGYISPGSTITAHTYITMPNPHGGASYTWSTTTSYTTEDEYGPFNIPASISRSYSVVTPNKTSFKSITPYADLAPNSYRRREYLLGSYAITTNTESSISSDLDWGPINYGYDPPDAKPSPRDPLQKFSYYGYTSSFYTTNNAVSTHEACIKQIVDHLYPDMVGEMQYAVGDFTNPSSYIDFVSSGELSDALANLSQDDFTVSPYIGDITTNLTVIVSSDGGSTTPATCNVALGVQINISANPSVRHDNPKPAIGGDIYIKSAQKVYYNFGSVRLY